MHAPIMKNGWPLRIVLAANRNRATLEDNYKRAWPEG
jgi:hypothetical protein